MIKLCAPETKRFHNFKCGEIYCETPTNYSVSCCLCGSKVLFDDFPRHFQTEHLSHDSTAGADKLCMDNAGNTSIKSEAEEEVTFGVAMVQMDDEKPIDLMEVQLSELDDDNKNIVVLDNLGIESDCLSLDDQNSKIKQPKDALEPNESEDDEDADNDADDLFQPGDDDDSSDDDSTKAAKAKAKDEIKIPCQLCERTYKSKRGLWNHIRINHKNGRKPRVPVTEHKCDECGETFSCARNLRGHKWKHTGIFCDICGKPFTQPGNMLRHKIRHTGIKAHKCQECDNTFYTDKELKAHMVRHTGIFPIVCEICGRRCRDHGVLTAHMRRHTGERPAKCEECGKCFYSVYDLNVHSVTHSSERPFSCDVCSSTFQTKKALRVHKKLHSSDRKHECKVCGKSFAQSGGLYSHMKTHDAADGV